MTTPATFLAAFCGFLAAVEVVRLLRADERDGVDTGTALVVVGIALAAAGWAGADRFSLEVLAVGLVAGALAVLAGAAIVARSTGSGYDSDEGGPSRGP